MELILHGTDVEKKGNMTPRGHHAARPTNHLGRVSTESEDGQVIAYRRRQQTDGISQSQRDHSKRPPRHNLPLIDSPSTM